MLIHSVFGLTQNWPPLMTPASQAIASRFTMLAGESDTIEMLVGNWLHEAASSSPADSSGLLHLAQRVGMPFLAGTDQTPAGFALHAELAVMVAEGLTPLHALQAATLNPAKLLHGTDSLGTVAPGKLADVVLLDADPLADITNTTTIRAVVANGRYFDRTALDSLLAKVRAEVP
jgi:imidazolonepropionase-like amidohydrolase